MHTHHHRHQHMPHIILTWTTQVAAINSRHQKVYDVVIERKEQQRRTKACTAAGLLDALAFPSCFRPALLRQERAAYSGRADCQKVYDVVIERKQKQRRNATSDASGLLNGLAFPSCFVGSVR